MKTCNPPFNSCILIRLFLIIVMISMLSCSSEVKNDSGRVRTIEAEGYRAEPQFYTVTIRSTGELLSWEDVELRSPVAGNVLKIYFNEGQSVNQGALLLEIDSRTWEAQKRGLEAQLESAESELERRERLLEIEGASQEIVDQSRVAVSELKARIDELDVRIDLAQIRAPFSGRLGMRNFSPGAFLSQGDIITRLVQSNKIRVNFDIPSRYAALPRVNMDVKVIPSAGTDTLTARIYAIEPMINAASRSLYVRAEIDNAKNSLFPGDFAQIIFDIAQDQEALLIPADAIIPELNRQVVYLSRNGIAKRQEVETGTRTQDMVHIINGLVAGDTILITGLMEVRDGSPARITQLKQGEGL
jgi:membrane fusion protein, multidrug efflux system